MKLSRARRRKLIRAAPLQARRNKIDSYGPLADPLWPDRDGKFALRKPLIIEYE
jgi:hypothetical protein